MTRIILIFLISFNVFGEDIHPYMKKCPSSEMPFDVAYTLAIAMVTVESNFVNIKKGKDLGIFQINKVTARVLDIDPTNVAEATCAWVELMDWKIRTLKKIAKDNGLKPTNRDVFIAAVKAYNAGNDFLSVVTLKKAIIGEKSSYDRLKLKYYQPGKSLCPSSHNSYAAFIFNALDSLKPFEKPYQSFHGKKERRKLKTRLYNTRVRFRRFLYLFAPHIRMLDIKKYLNKEAVL